MEKIEMRCFYDEVTEDFCAETDECGGLIAWGDTEEEAENRLRRDVIRFRRQERETAELAETQKVV